MRQNGIKDYRAALNTTTFINDPRAVSALAFERILFKNVKILTKNLENYYGVSQVYYDRKQTLYGKNVSSLCRESSYDFIRDSIKAGRFVYALYNHYEDTLNKRQNITRRSSYHCTLFTGYDDNRQEYISLIDGRYNVRYSDLEKMYSHYERLIPGVKPWILFCITPPQHIEIDKDKFTCDIYNDMGKTANDWYKEIEIMNEATNDMLKDYPKIGETLSFEKARKIYNMRIIFFWMRLGCHGNLYLKLKNMAEISGNFPEDFYRRFLINRQKSEVISNIFGRIYVDYSYQRLENVISKIKEAFVNESQELRQEFIEIIKNFERRVG